MIICRTLWAVGWMLITSAGWCAEGNSTDPVWDLSKNNIPATLQTGQIKKVDGKISLEPGAGFGVPAECFADPKNFTVQVTLELPALINNTVFTVMKKQGKEDNGFSCFFNYQEQPWWARHVSAVVNNVFIEAPSVGESKGPAINTPYTFTVSVRDGYASFYVNDKPYKKCYMEVIANQEPLWIGKNLRASDKPMAAVITSVKVYGAKYVYVSQSELKTEFPRGVVAGHGWALDVPVIEHAAWPKVLIYGDSISMGYREFFIPDMLKKHIYVIHCCHFVNGDTPKKILEEVAGRYKYDAIVFNNGLHSLHWTADKVSDQVVQTRMQDMVDSFRKGAPQAKIFYLLTTPHTAARPAPDKPVVAFGDKNDIVIRLNTISQKVIKERNIDIIDVYSILGDQLDLAGGDGYHWQGSGYKIMSDEIQRRLWKNLYGHE